MPHILDNPAWNALVSGNSAIAVGTATTKHFQEGISPFVGFRTLATACLPAIYDLLPAERPCAVLAPNKLAVPVGWEAMVQLPVHQMVCEVELPRALSNDIIPLGQHDVPAMVALAKLTNPGPFWARTIEFGDYHGIFDNGQLVAMCGRRMHPFHYIEISALCTHPGHTRKGYARQLISHQARRIAQEKCTPFLHVRADNETATNLYERLGFRIRTTLQFLLFRKEKKHEG